MAAVADTEEQLAWERRQAQGAALAALAAAFFTFVGTVWRGLTLGDLPRTSVADAIGLAAQPGPVGEATSLRVQTFEYYQDHATAVVLSSVMVAIGYLALGWTLSYLAAATRARRPELPKIMLYLPIFGGVLQGISTIVSSFATSSAISSFLDGPRTVDAALDIGTTGLAVFAQILGLPGALALALSLVLIALNAMRVGLLTRFMGVLGMITGALQILPIGGPLPVVQAFWLIMLGRALPRPLAQRPAARLGVGQGGAVAELGRRPRAAPEGDGRPPRRGAARGRRARRGGGAGPRQRPVAVGLGDEAQAQAPLAQRRHEPVVAQLLRRRAVQHPVAVLAPAERARAGELAHRGRDRRAVRADEVGQPLVAERERDDDAVRRDAAPALGEVPEREQEPVVDALVVRDRERDREVVGAARAAVEELDAELRPRHDPLHQPVVEHREPGRLQHDPADLGAHVRALVVPPPRPHHVAVAEQLAAAAAEHLDRPAQQPVDDQEAAMVRVGLQRGAGVPLAGREPQHAGERVAPRALELLGREELAQVGVGLDQADRLGPSCTGIPGSAMSARGRPSPDAPTGARDRVPTVAP